MKIPSLILGCVVLLIIAVFIFGKKQTMQETTVDNLNQQNQSLPKPSEESTQQTQSITDTGNIKAKLICENQDIQSEVVFVTTANQPIQLYCKIDDQIKVPIGYRKEFSQFEWFVSSGKLEGKDARQSWINPKTGLQTAIVSGSVSLVPTTGKSETIKMSFETGLKFLFPEYVKDISSGFVNGFEVGKYPSPTNPKDLALSESGDTVKRHADAYQPPTLFYEITRDTYPLKIFRDYTLGEFDLDPRFSPLEYPRYIALSPDLLKKMGILEDSMRTQSVAINKFKVIYGFRSPKYNLSAISTDEDKTLKSPFSMHMYGKAIDFIVDEDDDMVIDDLNYDGVINVDDAKTFREYIRTIDMKLLENNDKKVGAAIIYYHHDYYERGEYAQSPYVHMDTRGYVREDGSLIYVDTPQKIKLDPDHPYRLNKPIPKSPFQRMFERLKLY